MHAGLLHTMTLGATGSLALKLAEGAQEIEVAFCV
jgi:hypothetical protein